MPAGNIGDSFGVPGASGVVGSTGQVAGATGDNVPQATTGGSNTNLNPSDAPGGKPDDDEMKN